MPLHCIDRDETEDERENRLKKKEARRVNKMIQKTLDKSRKSELSCLKLLLLGTGESGKSTILKQMRIIHMNEYTDDEKIEFVSTIRRNLRDSMIALVAGMDLLNISFGNCENEEISRKLIAESLDDEYCYPSEFYEMVHALWADTGVKEAFNRSNEFQLIDSAKYFLDRIDVIKTDDYIPSLQDILRCRRMTDAINEIQFQIRDGRKTRVNFKVFDVGGQRGERKKWIQLFDNVTAILFIVDCSSFDLTLREDRIKNRLVDAFEVFQQAWCNKYLQTVPYLIFINKIDILEEKVRAGRTMDPLVDNVISWFNMRREKESVDVGASEKRVSLSKNGVVSRRYSLRGNSAFPSQKSNQSNLVMGTGSVMQILKENPYEEFTLDKKRDDDRRKFLKSYPLNHEGKTPEVMPETIRIACYVKHIFEKLQEQRPLPNDGKKENKDHRKYVFNFTCAVNTDNIQKVLDGCRSFLMEQHLERFGIL